MRPQNKKKETKPRKTAQTTQRQAKLSPLQKLEQERRRLLDRCARLATSNREKAEHICQQREQIEQWKNNCEGYKKIAISKIRLLKAGLILSLAVNIICIIILLYLINY